MIFSRFFPKDMLKCEECTIHGGKRMQNGKKPEILAPAGGEQQLIAALRCGADAVYFGTPDFNARRGAENFSADGFRAAVRDCHIRDAKAYITLNTLVTDAELPALKETLRLVADAGADAVIVQDLAVYTLARRCCPGLALHASTQMAAHNISGARQLEAMGFSRIVLARELSLAEIRRIAEAVSCEIEVFVHGAHCMSASGLCYLSAVFGGRSGNRGLCAQPCRLNFKAGNRENALSLKDMSLISHLAALADAGVDSFKIEGRMKRPEYVAAAVTAVKNTRDGQPADMETLRRVFSRSGFTDGYLTGRRNLSMFGVRSKEDVTAAAGVFPRLQALYKDEPGRVPVSMRFFAAPDEPCRLTVSDGAHEVSVAGPVPEAARTRAMDAALCERSLLKLGGTPYTCEAAACDVAPGLMLPAAALNALRREAMEKLSDLRAGEPTPFTDEPEPKRIARSSGGAGGMRLRFETAAQIPETIRAERVILPLAEIERDPTLISRFGARLAAEIPVLLYPADEARTLAALRARKEQGLVFAVCENIGAVSLAKQAGLTPTGGAHLNITNALALRAYEALGVLDCTLSFELHFAQIAALRGEGKTGALVYGRLPLMRFRACPMQGESGCGNCAGSRALTDRRGEAFPVLCSGKRFSTLYNPVPLYVGDRALPDTDFYTLYFTTETAAQCADVIAAFTARAKPAFRRTAGLTDKKLL